MGAVSAGGEGTAGTPGGPERGGGRLACTGEQRIERSVREGAICKRSGVAAPGIGPRNTSPMPHPVSQLGQAARESSDRRESPHKGT